MPEHPGRHTVLIVMGPDDSVDHLFSATNWSLGLPVWHDGNDLHDLTSAQRTFLRDSGWVMQSGALVGRYSGPEGAIAIGDTAWRVGVGDYPLTGERLILGTVLEFDVFN